MQAEPHSAVAQLTGYDYRLCLLKKKIPLSDQVYAKLQWA